MEYCAARSVSDIMRLFNKPLEEPQIQSVLFYTCKGPCEAVLTLETDLLNNMFCLFCKQIKQDNQTHLFVSLNDHAQFGNFLLNVTCQDLI